MAFPERGVARAGVAGGGPVVAGALGVSAAELTGGVASRDHVVGVAPGRAGGDRQSDRGSVCVQGAGGATRAGWWKHLEEAIAQREAIPHPAAQRLRARWAAGILQNPIGVSWSWRWHKMQPEPIPILSSYVGVY